MTVKDRSDSILGIILRLSLVTLIILSLLSATVSLQVARANPGPEITYISPGVVQGQTVAYTGFGFTANGIIDLSLESGYPSISFPFNTQANGTGFINDNFDAGSNILPGTRLVTFTDETTNETTTASFQVFEPVQFLTNPTVFPGAVSGNITSTTCGGLVGGQISITCGLHFDAAAILPSPSTGWSFDHWETTGNTSAIIPGSGISCSPLTNTNSTNCSGFSGGVLTAVFSAAIKIITDPANIGSVSFGSCSGSKYTNGSIVWRPELLPEFTSLQVCASSSYASVFTGWTSTGGITVANHLSPATTLQLTGPGTLTAHYGVQISLQAGWDLISLPIVPSDPLIGDLLKPLVARNEVVSVWTYAGTPRAWQVYVPGRSSTFSTMVDGNGYWIFMNSADKLNLTGTVIPNSQTPPSYPLVSGWNLLGFKPQPIITNETLSQYLGSVSGKYDPNNVWVYDNPSAGWIRAKSSYLLLPGQAIWILMTSPGTLKP